MQLDALNSQRRDIPFSETKFDRFFDSTLQDPEHHLGLKVALDGNVLGCSYWMFGGYFIGDDARIVTVNTICVDADVRSGILGGKVAIRLVSGIEAWARAWDAHLILYHVTSGKALSNIDRFFRKMGLSTLGGNYGVRLK